MYDDIEWRIDSLPIPYEDAVKFMEERVRKIQLGLESEMVWFLEHQSVYTAGSSADSSELLDTNILPVYNTGRGGKYTYHGPGQRVVYVMLDLKKRTGNNPDLRRYIRQLEQWIINTLAHFKILGQRYADRVGVWVKTLSSQEAKIAAIGVRVSKWVTYHGIALNITPEMKYFKLIIPCGIKEYGVTSMQELGYDYDIQDIDQILKQEFNKVFYQ